MDRVSKEQDLKDSFPVECEIKQDKWKDQKRENDPKLPSPHMRIVIPIRSNQGVKFIRFLKDLIPILIIVQKKNPQ